MNDDSVFKEYDDFSDDLSDEEKSEPEIFKDPFFDIEPYLRLDPNIADNQNLPELIFFLKAAWLDPYFLRNRTLCSLTTDDYLPEEKGLLILIQKLLNLKKDEPLDHHLLTVFCMITGRCSELLKFDTITSTNINTVNFKAPYQLYSHPGEGPCCISPYLIILSINETVTFPTVVCKLNTYGLNNNKDGLVEIEQITTTNLEKSFNYALREPPNFFPLSFESGLTLTNYVTRFPMANGDFWVRVTCPPFAIAYGSDMSNGTGKVKYPWTNRFNGKQPPTLSDNGSKPEVEWIDGPIYPQTEFEINYKDDFHNFCPRYGKDPESAFKTVMGQLHSEINDFVTIWADPETGRIRDSDMHFLTMGEAEKALIIVECNNFCQCHRNCICCFTNQPSFPHLMLFYSPDKDWGVVATEDIEPGMLITTYAGELKSDEDVHDANDNIYFFCLEFGDFITSLGYHALHKCNIGRFINQTHESPAESETPFSQPNATARKIMSTVIEKTVIGIFSLRKIYKGEEINIYYGENYKMQRSCACNYCLSDINEYREVLLNIDGKKSVPKKE